MTDLSLAEDEFDPSIVPMYPLVRAEIRDTTTGDFVGLVDDEIVVTGLDMEPVKAAIVDAAAAMAARRLGNVKAIRVRIAAADGGLFQAVVTASGEVYDTTTDVPASPSTSSSTSTSSTSWRGKTRTKRSIQTPDPDGDGKKGRVHPLFLVIIGFPLIMIGLFAWLLFFNGTDEDATAKRPGPKQLPVVAPQGYAPVAAWAVKVGPASGTTTGGVASDSQRAYAVTGSSDHITAYAAGTGIKQWSADLESTLSAGPTLATVDGERVVMAATSTRLMAFDPEDGDTVGEWAFEVGGGSQVRITATGPVVTGQSNTAKIIVDGKLTTRVMPAGALPVAPGPDGSLIAVTRDRVYASASATVSGEGRAITPGGPGEVTVAGWTGDRLVLAYGSSTSTSDGVRLAGYDVPSTVSGAWRRVWVSEQLASSTTSGITGAQLPLVTGPGGEWGIYAATTVSLDDGATHDLGEWSTVAVGDDIAFGTGASEVLSAGPAGLGGRSDPEPMGQQVTAPQAVAGARAYLVTGGGGTDAWLYALTPANASTGEGGER